MKEKAQISVHLYKTASRAMHTVLKYVHEPFADDS